MIRTDVLEKRCLYKELSNTDSRSSQTQKNITLENAFKKMSLFTILYKRINK